MAVPNGGQGVFVQSPGNVVGGSVALAECHLGQRRERARQLYTAAASGNTIGGNYVGTDATGRVKLGNGQCGVAVDAVDNLIGGFTAASRNVISANATDGALVADAGATGNRVWGNYVGTDARPRNPQRHLRRGSFATRQQRRRPDAPAQRHQRKHQVRCRALPRQRHGQHRAGEIIGTDASGGASLGNGGGVDITNGPADNLVGGASAAARNVISGNDAGGIGVYAAATRNRVEGNFIGTYVCTAPPPCPMAGWPRSSSSPAPGSATSSAGLGSGPAT